jgi:glycosyltransferase involved in cell wall biosynthesis
MRVDPIRVLHVVPDLVPYGLEKVVANLVGARDASRYEITVASLYGSTEGTLGAELEAHGARVVYLDKKRGFDVRMFPRLTKLFRQLRPHVLHTHNYVLRYTLPASAGAGVQAMVHTIHNVADREVDRLGTWLQKLAFRGLVHPVAIAEEVSSSYERVYRLPRPVLIPNGIDVNEFAGQRHARASIRRELGYGENDLLFLCAARFFPQKNHRTLLEAFAASHAQNAHLLLAGDGTLQGELEQQVRTLGLADRVRFLGRRDDVPALLSASDAFVLASLWEGNPLSVMEAMAAGLPVAVTGVGGVPELVVNEHSGLVVSPNDAAALTRAMDRLAADAGLRARLGANAAARAHALFDHREMVRSYEALYETLLPVDGNRGARAVIA